MGEAVAGRAFPLVLGTGVLERWMQDRLAKQRKSAQAWGRHVLAGLQDNRPFWRGGQDGHDKQQPQEGSGSSSGGGWGVTLSELRQQAQSMALAPGAANLTQQQRQEAAHLRQVGATARAVAAVEGDEAVVLTKEGCACMHACCRCWSGCCGCTPMPGPRPPRP